MTKSPEQPYKKDHLAEQLMAADNGARMVAEAFAATSGTQQDVVRAVVNQRFVKAGLPPVAELELVKVAPKGTHTLRTRDQVIQDMQTIKQMPKDVRIQRLLRFNRKKTQDPK